MGHHVQSRHPTLTREDPLVQIWDASSVAALDAISTKYERKGKSVEIIGLNEASAERHGRLSGELP